VPAGNSGTSLRYSDRLFFFPAYFAQNGSDRDQRKMSGISKGKDDLNIPKQ